MPPLRAMRHMLLSLFTTLWRRIRGASPVPSWPFGFEVIVGGLRRNFIWGAAQPLEVARDFERRLAESQPVPKGVTWGADEVAGVPVERLRPASKTPVGTLLYMHGGSHVAGSPATHRELTARLALAGPFEVLAIDFRLMPEHHLSDAIEDVLTVHGATPQPVLWAGDSSGGALAVLAMLEARERALPLPERYALISPWVDLRNEGASYTENRDKDWGTAEILRAQAKRVAGDRALDDPALSPAFADLRGLPPGLIHVGGAELVRDPVLAFAETLRQAGDAVTLHLWPDQVHDFHLLAGYHPDGAAAIEELAAFLRGENSGER